MGETGDYLEALQFLLNKSEILEEGLLFKVTPLESGSLGAEPGIITQENYNSRNDKRKMKTWSDTA